jgi:hypothetical protein
LSLMVTGEVVGLVVMAYEEARMCEVLSRTLLVRCGPV